MVENEPSGTVSPALTFQAQGTNVFSIHGDTSGNRVYLRGRNQGGTLLNILTMIPNTANGVDISAYASGKFQQDAAPEANWDLCNKYYVDNRPGSGALMSSGPPQVGTLAVGQLSLDTTTTPPSLWIGVPTWVDASGRKQITTGALTGTHWDAGATTWDGGATHWDNAP